MNEALLAGVEGWGYSMTIDNMAPTLVLFLSLIVLSWFFFDVDHF